MIEPSLPDLQEHISKFQAELKKMRQQFASRKAKLSSLINRRAELQTQLQVVETEMADLISALAMEEPSPAATSVEAPPATTPPKAPPVRRTETSQAAQPAAAKTGTCAAASPAKRSRL